MTLRCPDNGIGFVVHNDCDAVVALAIAGFVDLNLYSPLRRILASG